MDGYIISTKNGSSICFGWLPSTTNKQGTKVYLNIYDLSPANDVLYPIGFGFHHSGVEVLGVEYSFASGAGIFEATPKLAPNARFRVSLEMGVFEGGPEELRKAISELRNEFGPDDYHLIRKNCNSFANALVWKLVGRSIPGYVNRLADIGYCCSLLLPKKFLDQAPVGDPNKKRDSNNNSSGGFQMFAPTGSRTATSKSSASHNNNSNTSSAFTGMGARLSGGSSLTSSSSASSSEGLFGQWMSSSGSASRQGSSSNNKSDDLKDRREKARMAALARLERNKNDAIQNQD